MELTIKGARRAGRSPGIAGAVRKFGGIPQKVLSVCGTPKRSSERVLVLTSQDDFREMPSVRGLVG